MPENDKTNGDYNKAESKDENAPHSNSLLKFRPIGKRIAIVGGILVGGLLLISFFAPNMTERIKFFTVNLLSVIVLLAILVQTYIYRKQWQVMQVQAEASKAAANAAELSAKAAQESLHLMAQSERPDITVSVKMDDLTVGQPIQMVFDVFNAGRSTAYNFGIHVSCDWKDAPFDGILDYGEPKPEAAEPIRPGTHKFIHPHSWYYRLTIHDIASINFGTKIFFIYGILWYEDGAGRKYSEPFCRRYLKESPNDPVECPGSIREKMQEQPAEADHQQENPN